MELLRGNAHFAAQSEFSAVRKSRGGVHIDRRAVYERQKGALRFFVRSDDRFAVPRGVRRNMFRRRINVVRHPHRENVVEKFRIEILRARPRSRNIFRRPFVQAKFDGRLTSFPAFVRQAFL